MDQEYFYSQYKYLRKENSPVYGAASPAEVVYRSLSYDELCELLSREGTYLIHFGGPWCGTTSAVIDYMNFYARKYGVETVYSFDFRLAGTFGTSIREDRSARPDYEGPDKAARQTPGAVYDHLYGELVERFLTNLNDWVEYKVGTPNDVTYEDAAGEFHTVPKVQVPFLFLYNKDNRVDHSGLAREAGYRNEKGTYPIVYGFEQMAFRDEADGRLYTDWERHDETTLAKDYGQQLEEAIFGHIGEPGLTLTPYSRSDFIRAAFRANARRGGEEERDAFTDDEPINIQMVTVHKLRWMLEQEGGRHVTLFGGPWCDSTRATIAAINRYAVVNGVTVYLCDISLDGKVPVYLWGYPDARSFPLEGR